MMIPTAARGLSVAKTAAPSIALMARGGALVGTTTLVDLCASAAPVASMLIFFAVSES